MAFNHLNRKNASVDAVVIGAGIAGLYLVQRLKEMGSTFKVFEAGKDLGGTWFWNRYPGARFDSESYSYGYSWSQELLNEWEWSEHFAGQPETLKYLNYVADKFELRENIIFNSRVASCHYFEAENRWTIKTNNGETAYAKFLIFATGVLSEPYIPDFKGRDLYKGLSWHTSNWPDTPVGLADKKVGVIGTGATAVQLITEISKNIGSLTVFQRTANYCKPLRNGPIKSEEQEQIRSEYQKIFEKCNSTAGGFIHDFDSRSIFDVSPKERYDFFDKKWKERGFGFWLGNFNDIMTDAKANEIVAEFVREKIQARIKDPDVAYSLTPTDHPFGSKRVPLESDYYESYNRENVELVDLKTNPIKEFTNKGVLTAQREYEFDLIIFATGFDAVTGAMDKIDIRGVQNRSLKEKWRDGPRTFLGLTTAGFPNMFITGGPHNAASFCNVPRCLEYNVEWITDCILFLTEHGYSKLDATADAESEWTRKVLEGADATLLTDAKSWFMGSNIPNKKRVFLNYINGIPAFQSECNKVASEKYRMFNLS